MPTHRIRNFIVFGLPLIAALSVLTSCGGSSGSTAAVASIVVIPTVSSVKVNGTQTFTANALDASGNTVTNATFTWTSSTPSVADINSGGIATGKSGGTTQITATVSTQNMSSSPVTLTVLPQIGSVSITPSNATIKIGETQPFTATAKDINGNAVSGAVFDWGVSFSGVATIDKNGLVTGVSAGTALVTASTGGVTSPVATVNVTN